MGNINKKGFLWIGAMSANQSEGAWNTAGKGLSIADVRPYRVNNDAEISGNHLMMTSNQLHYYLTHPDHFQFPKRWGNDFYHRYATDLQLLKNAGLNTFRTSIAWSRIYPQGTEEKPNAAGLKFYHDLFTTCQALGMQVMVTISHMEMPVHLVLKYGGWQNKRVISYYQRFVTTIVQEFHPYIQYWIPFNEINHASFDNLGLLDDTPEYLQKVYQAYHNQFVANAWAVQFIKAVSPDALVGAMIGYKLVYPLSCHPDDVFSADYYMRLNNFFFLDVMRGGQYPWYMKTFFVENQIVIDITIDEEQLLNTYRVDFISISYYASGTVSAQGMMDYTQGNLGQTGVNPYLTQNAWGWQIDAKGLQTSLTTLYDRYQCPLYVVENGIGLREHADDAEPCINDQQRIDYLAAHLEALKVAITTGIDVRGYAFWSPIDCISYSTQEMGKRYGLVYVDCDDNGRGTMNRHCKQSYYWVQAYLKQNQK